MDFGNYKYVLGEVVMLYQYIENDIKMIIAALVMGDYKQNLTNVKNNIKGLGEAIRELERIDNYNGRPHFNANQYSSLKALARDRNYYCHSCSLDFSYLDNFAQTYQFKNSYDRLMKTREGLLRLQKLIEDYRVYVLSTYRGL